jgi:epoxyqueuosine reductase
MKATSYYSNLLQNFANYAQNLGVCALSIADTTHSIKNKEAFLEQIHDFPKDLDYLKKNQEVRDNPNLLLANAKSVITCAFSYAQTPIINNENSNPNDKEYGAISIYALGRDYHKVLKKKLKQLGEFLKKEIPELNYRPITDSAPFYEKFYASLHLNSYKGLNNLIRYNNCGSMILLAELIIDVKLPETCLFPTEQTTISCPINCNKCIKSCPTKALTSKGFNPNKCISFLTIEHKDIISEDMIKLIGNRIYGCDSCQLACPYNQKVLKSNMLIPDFTNRYTKEDLKLNYLLSLKEDEFKSKFAGSAIYRIGHQQFIRNVLYACYNSKNPSIDANRLEELKYLYPALNKLVDLVIDKLFTE